MRTHVPVIHSGVAMALIVSLLGTPSAESWPEMEYLPKIDEFKRLTVWESQPQNYDKSFPPISHGTASDSWQTFLRSIPQRGLGQGVPRHTILERNRCPLWHPLCQRFRANITIRGLKQEEGEEEQGCRRQ